MATYYSDKGGLRFQPRNRPEGALIAEPFTYTLTANPVNTDVIVLGRLPAGSTLVGFTVDVPICESCGTPAFKVGLGDSSNSTRFLNTVSAGNANTRFTSWISHVATNAASGAADGADHAALPRAYTSADDFRLTVTANATTAAGNGSVIQGTYFYVMQPFYSDPVL